MELEQAVASLAALAQGSRLDIVRLLVRAGVEGIPAGSIGERIGGVPAPTLSFHLSCLRHAGLVRCRREGRSLFYVADHAAMNGLLGYLTENCCQGAATPDQACCARSSAIDTMQGTRR